MGFGKFEEFIFDLIENREFGINSLEVEKVYNDSLKKISLLMVRRRRWGLVLGWLRKLILKVRGFKMKRLN